MEDRYEQFTGMIERIDRSIRSIKTQEMSRFGLRASHTDVLEALLRKDGQTVGELAQSCGLDKAAVSRAVASLREKGLVLEAGRNRYGEGIHLSEAGNLAASKMHEVLLECVCEISADISAEEREKVYAALREIADNLEKRKEKKI